MKKDYNYSKNKKCKDCNNLINDEATRCLSCANKGKKMSEKTKQKISKTLQGRKLNKETIKKMSGKNNHNYRKFGKDSTNFKGGKIKTSNGYIAILVSNHPYPNQKGYIMKHRLVIEAYLNKTSLKKWIEYGKKGNYPKKVRFLTKKEIVHHINGIRDDNRRSNLILFKNHKEHITFHQLFSKYIYKRFGIRFFKNYIRWFMKNYKGGKY